MNDELFHLYKFRAINKRLIESLVSRSLYFAKPSTLNDPFDCRINLESVIERAKSSAPTGERKDFLSSILGKPKFFETWQSTVDNLGVCAFSRDNSHPLLWSHYADEHSGVCVKYQFRAGYLLTEEFHLTTCGKVEYIAEPLTEWLRSAPMDEEAFVKELAVLYLKTKSPAWKYEAEERIIRNQAGVFNFNISEPFLNEVCFGLGTPPEDIDLIVNLARTYAGCARFSQMVRDETEFGFTEKTL